MSRGFRVPPEIGSMLSALAESPDPVFVTDRHNHIVFWNRSAERMLGYAENEVVGESCAALLQGCDLYGNRYCDDSCPITQMAARGEVVRHFGLALRAKDATTIAVDVSILNFTVPPPEGFYLAHILRPSERSSVSTTPTSDAAPCSTLMTVRASPDARARKLTPREVEVLGMLAAGRATPEIAARLYISTVTARNHVQNILDKLEVHSKAEAVAFAFQKRLL